MIILSAPAAPLLLPAFAQSVSPQVNAIYNVDALTMLKAMASESVNCVVTSPPYFGLRDYGVDGQIGQEPTPQEYVAALVEIFREVKRVLRHDGTCWVNIGDSYSGSGKGAWKNPVGQKETYVPSVNGRVFHRKEFLPPKSLMLIPQRLAIALQDDGWIIRNEIVWHKCLSGGARVYARTQKGDMPMSVKDLARLNPATVKLWNGEKWTQMKAIWKVNPTQDLQTRRSEANKRKQANASGVKLPITGDLEIVLRSGESIGCTREHRFPTQRGLLTAEALQIGDRLMRTKLPEPTCPKTPSMLDDDLIGWFVGLYIAEGSKSDTTIQIAGHIKEQERFAKLCTIAEAYHGTCRLHHIEGNYAGIHLYSPILEGILNTYVSGRTAIDKHLNVRCWQRSDNFLRAVLRGYLQGDGHWDEHNRRWRLGFTDNLNLASDLRTLCARLGISLRLRHTKHQMNGKTFKGYRGDIRLERSLHINNKCDEEIVEIRPAKATAFYDIAVEDEPHLFALASGVLTHNSNPMPESVTDRFTKAHESVWFMTKSSRYWSDMYAVREPSIGTGGGNFSEATAKAQPNHGAMTLERPADTGFRNARDVWTITPEPSSVPHFAPFPTKLVERCILAGCPEIVCAKCGAPHVRELERTAMKIKRSDYGEQSGNRTASSGTMLEAPTQTDLGFRPTCKCNAGTRPGVVLDIFMGTGTTAWTARYHGRDFIGCDLNYEYVQWAKKRLKMPYDVAAIEKPLTDLPMFAALPVSA